MVASSGVSFDISPPGDSCLAGVGLDSGVTVGEERGEGLRFGPAGTTCCGLTLALIGSNGRLVRSNARKVASAAATIMLTAAQTSGVPVLLRLRGPRWERGEEVSTVNRLRERGRLSGMD